MIILYRCAKRLTLLGFPLIPFFWLIREGDLMAGIVIRTDFEPCELRALAKSEKDARVVRRLLAIAGAMEGLSRADAARLGGMDRQTLRDWVIRFKPMLPRGSKINGMAAGQRASLRLSKLNWQRLF